MIASPDDLVTEAAAPQETDPRSVHTSPIRAVLIHSATLVFAVNILLIAFFALLSPNHVFWSLANAEALLRNGAEILVLALGVTLLMSAGVFDLSVGANLVLASVISALSMRGASDWGVDPVTTTVLGLVICLAAGAAFGTINGLIITRLKVNSLIATLGTLGVGSGAAQLLTNGQDVRQLPDTLQSDFALAKLGIVPAPMLCALILLVGVWALLRFTRFGMRTLAIGSNMTAATRAGIAVHQHIVRLAALAGAFAGFAGFVDLARFGSTAIASHSLDGLNAVTAVVIGGTALTGGRASVIGTLWGAALSIILLSGLIIIRVQPFWQLVATGIVLILAVAFDQFRARTVERG
jgi:ribose transport system permease protein